MKYKYNFDEIDYTAQEMLYPIIDEYNGEIHSKIYHNTEDGLRPSYDLFLNFDDNVNVNDIIFKKTIIELNIFLENGKLLFNHAIAYSRNTLPTYIEKFNDLFTYPAFKNITFLRLVYVYDDYSTYFNNGNIKTFESFSQDLSMDILNYQDKYEDIFETMNIWNDTLLKSINAEEVDLYDELELDREMYQNKLDINFLESNVEFINSLTSLGLKKTEVMNSNDFETFLKTPCKYMFIYKQNYSELQNPDYLLFQTMIDDRNWDNVKLYKVNGNVDRFYDKLSSKTIEIIDNGTRYIYSTSNGNEWILQNTKPNDAYEKVFRRKEIQKIINERDVEFKII